MRLQLSPEGCWGGLTEVSTVCDRFRCTSAWCSWEATVKSASLTIPEQGLIAGDRAPQGLPLALSC